MKKSAKVKVNCPQCNKPVYLTQYNVDRGRKYCSLKCFHLYSTGKPGKKWAKSLPSSTCKVCSATFTPKRKDSKTCSFKCGRILSGKKRRLDPDTILNEYPPEFYKIRPEIYENDNWTCQICGVKCSSYGIGDPLTTITCHHIDYDKNNNDRSNLITVCCSDHGRTNADREDWQKFFSSTFICCQSWYGAKTAA